MAESDVENLAETIFPFGKFKGKPLGEIPVSYLEWAQTATSLPARVRLQISDYLKNPTQKSLSSEHRFGSNDVTAILPLPGGNRVEIRIKRRIAKEELRAFRKVVKFIEEFITEE